MKVSVLYKSYSIEAIKKPGNPEATVTVKVRGKKTIFIMKTTTFEAGLLLEEAIRGTKERNLL